VLFLSPLLSSPLLQARAKRDPGATAENHSQNDLIHEHTQKYSKGRTQTDSRPHAEQCTYPALSSVTHLLFLLLRW
jgi:hypothetical protein